MPLPLRTVPLLVAAMALICAGLAPALAAPSCSVLSTDPSPSVVELYTSEGCSSCPPADRWLSRVNAEPRVVALAFHVDYWDRLGWKDRFASAEYTGRQSQQKGVSGARFSYTPQVLVDGVDRPDWAREPLGTAPRQPATVSVRLSREAGQASASVVPRRGAPARLAAYWAVTEDGHVSAVGAGENRGATLTHDGVVRAYRPVAAWLAEPGVAAELRYDLPHTSDPAHAPHLNLVILDASTGRPVQAVKLGC